jgi:hypothetical protein
VVSTTELTSSLQNSRTSTPKELNARIEEVVPRIETPTAEWNDWPEGVLALGRMTYSGNMHYS